MKRQNVAQTLFLPARDCPNVRTAIETLVSGILNNGKKQCRRKNVNIYEREAILNFKIIMDLVSSYLIVRLI